MHMNLAPGLLDRSRIEQLLRALGARLAENGHQAEIYLVGGAAIAVAFDSRRTTRDIDGVFEPKMVVYQVAAQLADEYGLETGWLNDAVKGLLPGPDPDATLVVEYPGLTVTTASPEYLLAMKVAAARVDRDVSDIRLLAKICGFTTAAQTWDCVVKVWGSPRRLLPKSKFILEEIFSNDEE